MRLAVLSDEPRALDEAKVEQLLLEGLREHIVTTHIFDGALLRIQPLKQFLYLLFTFLVLGYDILCLHSVPAFLFF